MVNLFGGYAAKANHGDDEATALQDFKRRMRAAERQLAQDHVHYPAAWQPRLKELRDVNLEFQIVGFELDQGVQGFAVGSPEHSAASLSKKQSELQAGKIQEELDHFQKAFELTLAGKSLAVADEYLEKYREAVSRVSEDDKFHKMLL